MQKSPLRPYFFLALALITTTLLTQAQTYTYSTFVTFNSRTGPLNPLASLIVDSAGNLYGTSPKGGDFNHGTVFKITPDGSASVLYSFKGIPSDGAGPSGRLFMDPSGNLYGTTSGGGNHCISYGGCGTVFKLTPSGEETVLYDFIGFNDGAMPNTGVAVDSAGNVYGTTINDFEGSGDAGNGDVFKIDASGKFSILHLFCNADPNCNDGQYPVSSPVLDASGNLWGTTAGGGANNGGTLYKIDSAGKERVIYNFSNEYESEMQGDLTRDAQGNFYTVKYAGNFNTTDGGKIFKITPSGQESEPYTFCTLPGCPGGDVPRGPIQIDAAGNLYGVVTQGGANGTGGVFEVNTSGTETLLHSFEKGILTFFNGIVIDSAGNLYGTTTTGGPNKHGTVYKLTLQK